MCNHPRLEQHPWRSAAQVAKTATLVRGHAHSYERMCRRGAAAFLLLLKSEALASPACPRPGLH